MARPTISQLNVVLTIAFFALFFILFTVPIYDGDCFWHLATGRWIAEHHALPVSDPFSFTVTNHNPFRPDSNRVEFLLKQYWLGQLAMFGTWSVGGDAGIVLLRATIYTGILAFLFFWMRRLKPGLFPIVLTFLTGILLKDYPNERPQLFSFIFTPLVIYFLEKAVQTEIPRRLALISLPLIMLVWANTHGAYILGVVLIGIYLAAHLIECTIRRAKPDYPFITTAVAGIIITVLNPAGLLAWKQMAQTLPAYLDMVTEYRSPWKMATVYHKWYPAYWVYLFVMLLAFLTSWRLMKLRHMLTLVALATLSLTAMRYIHFPLLVAPLLVRYLPALSYNIYSIAVTATTAAIWLVVVVPDSRVLAFEASNNFPSGAISFIRDKKPAPQIFNYIDWGGYLSWKLPGIKTFIDGRTLVEEHAILNTVTLYGIGWQATFDRYGINTVIIPGMGIADPGYPLRLATSLADTPTWRLVFVDDRSLVFVRNIPANQSLIAQYGKDRQAFHAHLLSLAEFFINIYPEREDFWETKANALSMLGKQKDALEACRRILLINPGNQLANRMLSDKQNENKP